MRDGGGGDEGGGGGTQKPHRKPHSGRKADKKGRKTKVEENVDPRVRNPKAFAINSVVRAERKFRRTKDIETKKDRVPLVDRSPVDPPPFVIAIVGPPKVGKSTLFMNLVKNYTRQTLSDIKGPVTIVSGKKRRLTLIECNNDINSMIDVAKVADLALLLVDASFGFEMEVFEFLNICQVHGFPQIMGVLTHLDLFRNKKKLKKTKKTLKHRFWTEVYPGAKLFYLSGYFPMTQTYPKNEVHNLARFISVMKFRSTTWKSEHAYLVADRMEDLTSLEAIRVDPKVDRRISLYGWVHGTFLKQHVSVHVPGLGDFTPDAITALPDPCPLPHKERVLRRTLNEKEKIMYAPFSGVGGIVYDQDAVYIDLGGSHSHHKSKNRDTSEDTQEDTEKGNFVSELRDLKTTLDEKMDSAGLKLFSTSEAITGAEVINEFSESEDEENNDEYSQDMSKNFTSIVADDGRVRRRVIFDDEKISQVQDKNESRIEEIDDDDDDVVQSIQKELKELKKSEPTAEKVSKSKAQKSTRQNRPSSDSSEIETDDDDISETKNKSSAFSVAESSLSILPRDDSANQDVFSIVSKLKSKLKTGPENQEKEKSVHKPVSVPTERQQSVDSDSENSLADDDEVDIDDEIDDDVSETELNDSDEDNLSEKSDNDESEIEFSSNDQEAKDKRFSLAEDAFYSRFRNRSTQKMIYDDTEDYLNVTSRADFDVANSNVKERQEDVDDDVYMKDLFIGGDYAETAKQFLDAENDSDDDMFGDFEELDEEADEKISKPRMEVKPEDEDTVKKKREDMKKQLKEKFDMEYDDGGDDKTFYKEWKAQVEEQTKINRTFFDNVDDPNLLRDLQGLTPGTYVRVEISKIPFEFVTNFDPQRCCPLVVGSLDSPNQETLAVVQARVKKHRWHPKILKTRDPLILSVGWRRFQTISLYSVQDHNMRNRMIKYTPEHLHCIANFYGPMTPQGTGILGIAPAGFEGFRIVLTGTILDMDKSSELVKKLKLVGTPAKIYKKSAFIEGMFTSQLEVAKFVGAKIKTVSGIRGVIKKELRTPVGAFRATFEDKIVASDIVFCRTWAKVDVPPFYLNIPTHVVAQPRLMKTVGQLKRERDVKAEPNPDHLYTPIERTEKRFRPLKIPKRLQEKLPFKDKPKVQAKLNAPQRIAVVKDPHEREMTKFIRTLKTRMSDKEAKEKAEKAKRAGEREKVMKKLEVKQTQRQKELRKKVFRTLGLMNKTNPADGKPPGKQFGGRPPKHRRK